MQDTPNPTESHKTVFVLLGIVVLAVILVVVLMFASKQKQQPVATNEKPAAQQKEAIVKTEVDPAKTPEKFPLDVPIEAGAKITQNYNATAVDGRFQATRTFETAKSLDANLKIYTDFLKANGWKIQATVDQPTFKMVMGTKDQSQLQISMSENSVSKTKTVDISLTDISKVNTTK